MTDRDTTGSSSGRSEGIGSLASIRERTDEVVTEIEVPEADCPLCGLALPGNGPPTCPRCGVPSRQ